MPFILVVIQSFHEEVDYISEFTNDVRHIQGKQNLIADALSRIEINKLSIFQEGLDFKEIAEAQENDDFIQSFLKDASKSSLKLEEIKMDNSDQVQLCDVSTSKVRPIIPKNLENWFLIKYMAHHTLELKQLVV